MNNLMRTCTCGRRYSTTKHGGTKELCAMCYARKRRGGLKRPADPDRGDRTHAVQVWFTPAQFKAMTAAHHPLPFSPAEWIRGLVDKELFHLAARKRLGLGGQ